MTLPANQQFTTRSDRLWADKNLDLAAGQAYKIDNVPVLSYGELGITVTKSNLRQIGTLNTLEVTGNALLGEFAYFNSTVNRLGLGTDEPNASISILDNNVEIAIGSPAYGLANIGTYSNSDLAITTDNIARITVKNSGEVIIGDAVGKNGVLRVHGSIYVDNFVSDTRVDRSSSLEFKASKEGTVYGLGLTWASADFTRQLIMKSGPDRLWTNVSFDLAENHSYFLNGKPVLTETGLGSSVVTSNLVQVGSLESLTVSGNTTLQGDLIAGDTVVKSLGLNNGVNSISIDVYGINSNKSFRASVKQADVLYGDDNEIVLGNSSQSRRPVKVFGQLSVGINNPDPSVGLAVAGDLSFSDKKFTTGDVYPTEGQFNKGDICWNSNPQASSYVGWICVVSGTPGQWLPFGAINRQ
jgi:hypothetical protein